MSKMMTLTSFQESSAWQNVLYRYANELTVESPGVKPDWKDVSRTENVYEYCYPKDD